MNTSRICDAVYVALPHTNVVIETNNNQYIRQTKSDVDFALPLNVMATIQPHA